MGNGSRRRVTWQRASSFRLPTRPGSARQAPPKLTVPAQGFIEHCVEHRNEVSRRGIDDLQSLSRGGLLLQRFASFGQKARVLDGNHCLVGKGLDQFYL